MKKWLFSVYDSILNKAVRQHKEQYFRQAYRIQRVNVILVLIGQVLDTFDSPLTSKKLIETFNFTVSDFLALHMQVWDTSIDLRRIMADQKNI